MALRSTARMGSGRDACIMQRACAEVGRERDLAAHTPSRIPGGVRAPPMRVVLTRTLDAQRHLIVDEQLSSAEGRIELGRPLLGHEFEHVSRDQAVLRLSGEGLLLEARGRQPTGLRSSEDIRWRWFKSGETAALQTGDDLALDCRLQPGSVLKVSISAALVPAVGRADEQAAPQASSKRQRSDDAPAAVEPQRDAANES